MPVYAVSSLSEAIRLNRRQYLVFWQPLATAKASARLIGVFAFTPVSNFGIVFAVNACMEQTDLEALSESMFKDFDSRVAGIPKDLCSPFYQEARQLEAEVLVVHKVITRCIRRETDLATIAQIWGGMVTICSIALNRLHALVDQHPYCGAGVYYDRLLDLRNKCKRLQEMHS
jgi:hypothetical protein